MAKGRKKKSHSFRVLKAVRDELREEISKMNVSNESKKNVLLPVKQAV